MFRPFGNPGRPFCGCSSGLPTPRRSRKASRGSSGLVTHSKGSSLTAGAGLSKSPLGAGYKGSSRHSKLEKADILEMTVKHLRSLQRAQMTAALSADPTVLGKYRAGFNECMNEVTRFLSGCEGVPADVRARLLGHLSACLGQIVAVNYPPAAVNPAEALSPKVYGGFQLVPAAEGPFAFLIPSPPFAPSSAPPLAPLYGSTAGAAAPAASPVRGLTAFAAAQAGGPGGERGGSVWRPW
uniref:Hes family bHLH transcription factor 4 n=1 Tax=Nothoprocta perdicaria TaxID=30464 RepID=A0A8C6Z2A2_NOTPE